MTLAHQGEARPVLALTETQVASLAQALKEDSHSGIGVSLFDSRPRAFQRAAQEMWRAAEMPKASWLNLIVGVGITSHLVAVGSSE